MTPEQNKESRREKMKEKVENIQAEKKKSAQESEPKEVGNEEKKEEKKTVSLTTEEFDAIKLQMAKVINDEKELEKDFENYRKRSREEVEKSFADGQTKALETILPALDSFKKAKKMILDEASIEGVNLIEKSIMQALEKLGVKKMQSSVFKMTKQSRATLWKKQKVDTPLGTRLSNIVKWLLQNNHKTQKIRFLYLRR